MIASTSTRLARPSLQARFAYPLLFCLLLSAASIVRAQTSATDGTTPPGMAPGAPAGSYSLSDIDQVNLFSGNLNFHLPLLSIGGRGGAQMKITLAINSVHWRTEQNITESSGQQGPLVGGSPPFRSPVSEGGANLVYYTPIPEKWSDTVAGLDPGYGPGGLIGRRAGEGKAGGGRLYGKTLTRLTFIASDGTEYELRDQLTGGQPHQNALGGQPFSRGTVFVSAAGGAATFISDTPITDAYNIADDPRVFPTGYLLLADGIRFRVEGGLIKWTRDRNGNRLSFTYGANSSEPLTYRRVLSITDSLNRVVTVSYADMSTRMYDQISYKGSGGAPRTIKIWHANLGQVLRPNSGYTIRTNRSLFLEFFDASETLYDPTEMVSAVELPDGRRYRFYYNPYGELARVELPTGGAFEYDYAPGSGVVEYSEIHRRVIERRVLPDGVNLAMKQIYNATYTPPGSGPHFTTVTVEQRDAGNSMLAGSKHYFYGSPVASMFMLPTFYPSWKESREYQSETLAADGSTVLRRVVSIWQQRALVSWWTGNANDAPPNDPRVVETLTTLADANLVTKQTFAHDQYNNVIDTWEYDFGAGAPGPLIRRTHTPYLTTNPNQGNVDYAADVNIHIRNLPVQKIVYDASGNVRSQTDYIYDNYGVFAPVGRPGIVQHADTLHYGAWGNLTEVILHNPGGAPSEIHLHNQYDIAGNLVKAVDGRGFATDIDFSDRFDSSPDDEAQSNAGAHELGGGFSYAFPTKVTNALGHTSYTQYDYYLGTPVNTEDANGIVSSVAYNDALDRPTQGIQARYKVGSGALAERSQTTITYDDANRVITIGSDLNTFNDNVLTTKSYYDGLGRTWRSAAYEGPTWSIRDTRFDARGRVSQVSNPYRAADPGSASPPAGLWTTTEYDALGRVIKVTTPDAAHIDTAYSGNQVTVTDQAGKRRRSITDALGRLVEVIEDPGGLSHVTTYLYDALGNLRQVTQGGQKRWFAYDSLSRLIRAKNPEQDVNANPNMSYTDPVTVHNGWSTAYKYAPNGNLTERTDARGVITTYTYDALNRNTVTHYVNGSQTRSVEIVYDGAANGKGRLHREGTRENGVDSTETKIDSYDALGRPLKKHQSFWRGSDWGTPFVIQQSYDLAGAVKTLTYPSGRTVNYSYDQAGRLSSFTGNLGDGVNRNYAIGIQYDAAGSMKREQFGTNIPLYHRRHYSNRLQLFDIRLGTDPNPLYDSDDLDAWQNATGSWNRGALRLYYSTLSGCHIYGNGGTDNNGNLLRMDHHIPVDDAVSNFVASIDRYDYDPLNRLKSVTELSYTKGTSGNDVYQGIFRQAFLYDRWGNRTIDQASTSSAVNHKAYTVDATTNRLTTVDGVAMSYDAAGNQTNDGSGQRVYDSENRMVEAYNSAGVRVSWYVYDAAGKRVVRTLGSQGTWNVYGIGGELLAEYAVGASPSAAQKEYGYRSGLLLVVWDGGETGDRQLQWLVQDHLGSTRMVVDRSGSLGGIRRHDFLPFGEELSAGVGIRSASNGYSDNSVRQKYTSKEHDSETGLDYFLARYYSNMQGRFTSPDTPFADQYPQNPQSWNLYSYTRNNPARVADQDGRITPWDIMDVISLGLSIRDLWQEPSWTNLGWVVADAIGAALPLVPVGSLRITARLAKALDRAAAVKNLDNALEVAAFEKIIKSGAKPLATGADNVRSAVGITDGGPVADIVSLTSDTKFIITEVKQVENVAKGTADIGHAVEQLKNTANALLNNIPGAKISTLEIVLKNGTNLGPNFTKNGDQLLQFNSATGKWEPVRVRGSVVHIREID